jgi:hypothetical protein
LVFSHRMDAVPLWRGIVGQAEVGKDGTPPTNAGGTTALHNDDRTQPSKPRQRMRDADGYQLLARCVLSLCDPPQPKWIERPGAAQVNVQTGVVAISTQNFLKCDKKAILVN